jgi:archaellum component FlaF (FlaF/FlaG flagellin family)
MRFSTAAVALVSAVASVKASTFNVQVGFNDSLVFNPSNLTGVANGDQVNFQFVSKNHSVVQSTFAAPCTAAGVSSGFQNVSDPSGTSFPTWTITVDNASAPLWFFCSQVTNTSTHCQSGMVFAINPTAAKSFTAFQAAAIATNGTGPQNPSGSIISGSAGATDPVVSVSGSASEPAVTAGTSGSASGSTTGTSSGASPSASNGARQLMSGSSISLLAVAGLVAGLAL